MTTVDARELPPLPDALADAMTPATFPERGSRSVIMLDSFELLQPLETLVRDQLLPALGADTLVVLASQRHPAPAGWPTPAGRS